MRYLLHNHPTFPDLLSKDELYELVERSSLARGDFCTDTLTQRDHTVGEVISDVRSALVEWEPRIDILDIDVLPNPAHPNLLQISINYQVRTTNNQFNLVYPFYLQFFTPIRGGF